MKKLPMIVLALAVGLMMTPTTVLAKGWGKHHKESMEHKVFKKVMMIKEHQNELQFSDQDVEKALNVKIALKKDLIKLNADLDTVKVDIAAAKKAKTLDVNKLNGLIDQKYEIKKKKAKRVLAAYAEVKGMFTEERKAKIKEIYAQKGKDGKGKCQFCMKKMKGSHK